MSEELQERGVSYLFCVDSELCELNSLKKNGVLTPRIWGPGMGPANILFQLHPDRVRLQGCTWDGGWLPATRYDRDQRTKVLCQPLQILRSATYYETLGRLLNLSLSFFIHQLRQLSLMR